MRDIINRFLEKIFFMHPPLKIVHDKSLIYWEESEANTVEFGEIGDKIVDDFDIMNDVTKTNIFTLIEEAAVESGDDPDSLFGAYIYTGLIEGIVHRSFKFGIWEKIRPSLGAKSVDYADGWIDFTNGK